MGHGGGKIGCEVVHRVLCNIKLPMREREQLVRGRVFA
jgi:hypothetical protein